MTSRSRRIEDTEGRAQEAFIRWARTIGSRRWWPLSLAYHIPNGMPGRSARSAVRMVREGLLKGMLDVCVPFPLPPYAGLYIEMKHESGHHNKQTNGLSEEQATVAEQLRMLGYRVMVCWSSKEAILATIDYVVIGMSNQSRRHRRETRSLALQALLPLGLSVKIGSVPAKDGESDWDVLVGLEQTLEAFVDYVQSGAFDPGTRVHIGPGLYVLYPGESGLGIGEEGISLGPCGLLLPLLNGDGDNG